MTLTFLLFTWLMPTGWATTPACSPFLASLDATPLPGLNQTVRLLTQLTSPSLAVSVLAKRPEPEAFALTQRSELSPAAWRRLTELAFARVTDGRPVDLEQRDRVLDVLFAAAPSVRVPRPVGRWSFWIRTPRPIASAVVGDDFIRHLFRARPAIDLRTASPRLATRVPARPRYADTFAATLKALFADVAAAPPGPYATFDQWTALVETSLRRDFPDAPDEVASFVAQALDRRFLGVPAPPGPAEVVAAVMAARAVTTEALPGRGLEGRVIPTPSLRERATPTVTEVPVVPEVAKRPREVVIHASAEHEVAGLPPHIRRKLDDFIAGARDPVRYREMVLARGSWNIEALVQFGPDALCARLSAFYRVLYDLNDDVVVIRRVNKGQIHGN